MSKEKVLLIYSGGLDSTVLLSQLLRQGKEVQCLNFSYGSKHNEKERKAAVNICIELNVLLRFFDLDLSMFNSSLLVTGEKIPEGHYEAENMESTVVPFRNGIMLSIAAGLATSIEFRTVAIAVHAGDHYIYPDCRELFINSMENAMYDGTEGNVNSIYNPFVRSNKVDIVALGNKIGAPMHLSWTCYNGRELHCGKCGSCVERKEAFEKNGLEDPTEYEK